MISLHQFWTLAICLTGTVQCFFLSSYFGFLQRGNVLTHRLLAILMGLLGLRLAKSAYFLFEGETMPLWLINMGFAAHAAVAPLLFLYLYLVIRQQKLNLLHLLHFIPAILIIIFTPILKTDTFWYRGGYSALLVYSLIYWILAVQLLFLALKKKEANSVWLVSLFFGVSVFLLAYFFNYILRLIPYEIAPVIYSISIFPVSFAAWRNYQTHSIIPSVKPTKYKNIDLKSTEIERYKSIILNYIEKQQPYLDPEFSLQQLSEKTQIPAHQLSHILNQHLHTNFTSLINRYRIQKASEMLKDPKMQHFTIAAIAFTAGFNSLSVFNQTFKKQNGATPSSYRASYISKS